MVNCPKFIYRFTYIRPGTTELSLNLSRPYRIIYRPTFDNSQYSRFQRCLCQQAPFHDRRIKYDTQRSKKIWNSTLYPINRCDMKEINPHSHINTSNMSDQNISLSVCFNIKLPFAFNIFHARRTFTGCLYMFLNAFFDRLMDNFNHFTIGIVLVPA